jgi:hypothetical protein
VGSDQLSGSGFKPNYKKSFLLALALRLKPFGSFAFIVMDRVQAAVFQILRHLKPAIRREIFGSFPTFPFCVSR